MATRYYTRPVSAGHGLLSAALGSGIERGIANWDARRRQGIEDKRRHKRENTADDRATARFANEQTLFDQGQADRPLAMYDWKMARGGQDAAPGMAAPPGTTRVGNFFMPTVQSQRDDRVPMWEQFRLSQGIPESVTPSMFESALRSNISPQSFRPWDLGMTAGGGGGGMGAQNPYLGKVNLREIPEVYFDPETGKYNFGGHHLVDIVNHFLRTNQFLPVGHLARAPDVTISPPEQDEPGFWSKLGAWWKGAGGVRPTSTGWPPYTYPGWQSTSPSAMRTTVQIPVTPEAVQVAMAKFQERGIPPSGYVEQAMKMGLSQEMVDAIAAAVAGN